MRTLQIAYRLVVVVFVLVIAAGCGDDPLIVPADAMVTPADAAAAPMDLPATLDLTRGPDLAALPDLTMPRDLAAPIDAGLVLCSLPDQPIACTRDAECVMFGGRCDAQMKSCVCLFQSCRPGADQSCNEDPRLASLHGHCTAFGACECKPMFPKSPTTGKCL